MGIEIPWGESGSMALTLPEHWRVMGVIVPEKIPPISDIQGECTRALLHPTGSEPLSRLASRSSRVCIIIDDASRPTPTRLLLPQVIHTLEEGGIRPGNISILCATGLHRPMSAQEMKEKLGQDVVKKFPCTNHDSHDSTALVSLGRTSRGTDVRVNRIAVDADLRVLIGTIEPHVQAGFGGGFKNILPGVSGAETIGHNHFLSASETHLSMIGSDPETNPMRLDIEEAGNMLPGRTFIVNTVLASDMKPAAIVSGDPVKAHREGLKVARRIYGAAIPGQADIIVTNSFPMHLNLRQDVKSVANTLFAARAGGTVLALWRSIKGFDDKRVELPGLIPPVSFIRMLLKALGSRGIKFLAERLLSREQPEERFFTYFALQALRRNNILIYSPTLYEELMPRSKKLPVFGDIGKMYGRADSLAGKRGPSVLIFPKGGVTYPVVKGAA